MTVELNLADGDTWSASHVNTIEAGINTAVPVGSVQAYIGATAPNSDWKLLDGSTITNAQTLNAALWAVAPVAWRSGSNLVLPNMANRMLEGQSTTTLGATGGANTSTIATGNLPAHTHTFSGTSSNVSNDHTHAYSGSTSNNADAAEAQTGSYLRLSGAPTTVVGAGAVGVDTPSIVVSTGHTHTYSGNTGGISNNHTHTYSGTTSSIGSGTALTVTNAHLAVNFILKVQ